MSHSGLRIAMVTTFYPPFSFGGDGVYVRQLAHALARRGHRVDILHSIDAFATLQKGPMPEPLEEPAGVRVTGLHCRFPMLSCLATQQLGRPVVHASQIEAQLTQNRYDVIHYHNISLVGGPVILSYGQGIKLYTAHEHWLVCPTHVLWRHDQQPCNERQCLRCTIHYRRPPQVWRSFGLLAKHTAQVDAFCALSRFSAQKHAEFGFTLPMHVLPSFIADTSADAGGTASPPSRPFFLFVGRLEKIKGAQDLIPLFKEDIGADLLLAGSGGFDAELKALAGDSAHIRFLGALEATSLRELYRQAHAVLLPSICFEVFPLVALEALREGVPIIARALGPFPEIIEYSGGGLLFSNTEELQHAIGQLLHDAEMRERLALAGRAAFNARWNESSAMTAYTSLIRKLAVQRGADQVLSVLDRCAEDGQLV